MVAARSSSIGQTGWAWRRRWNSELQLELERDEVQELPMLLRPGSAGDGGAEEPEEHEQLSAGTAGRGRDVDGLGATRAWHARSVGEVTGSNMVVIPQSYQRSTWSTCTHTRS
jgi:hypothetical protein